MGGGCGEEPPPKSQIQEGEFAEKTSSQGSDQNGFTDSVFFLFLHFHG